MVVHTARAESRVKCCSLPCFLPSPPAGGRTGLVLVWLDIPDIWKPTQPHFFLFGQLDKLVSDFVSTEMLNG